MLHKLKHLADVALNSNFFYQACYGKEPIDNRLKAFFALCFASFSTYFYAKKAEKYLPTNGRLSGIVSLAFADAALVGVASKIYSLFPGNYLKRAALFGAYERLSLVLVELLIEKVFFYSSSRALKSLQNEWEQFFSTIQPLTELKKQSDGVYVHFIHRYSLGKNNIWKEFCLSVIKEAQLLLETKGEQNFQNDLGVLYADIERQGFSLELWREMVAKLQAIEVAFSGIEYPKLVRLCKNAKGQYEHFIQIKTCIERLEDPVKEVIRNPELIQATLQGNPRELDMFLGRAMMGIGLYTHMTGLEIPTLLGSRIISGLPPIMLHGVLIPLYVFCKQYFFYVISPPQVSTLPSLETVKTALDPLAKLSAEMNGLLSSFVKLVEANNAGMTHPE